MSDHAPNGPHARMVDVGDKEVTRREAVAEAVVTTLPEVVARVVARDVPKGDVLRTAETAGLLALKKTPDLLPHCHPIALRGGSIRAEVHGPAAIRITATARADDRTGVEMEVLTAASVAALTVYDMLKMFDAAMTIGPVRLLEKSGGKSGRWTRPDAAPADANAGAAPPLTEEAAALLAVFLHQFQEHDGTGQRPFWLRIRAGHGFPHAAFMRAVRERQPHTGCAEDPGGVERGRAFGLDNGPVVFTGDDAARAEGGWSIGPMATREYGYDLVKSAGTWTVREAKLLRMT